MPLQQPTVARQMLVTKLKEAKYIWVTLAALVIFWLIAYHLPLTKWLTAPEFKDHVRWYGILLEVAAIWSIAYELNNSLTAAGRRPLVPAFIAWLDSWRFIIIRGKAINLEARSTIGSFTSIGTAVVRSSPTGTTEEQLAKLNSMVEALENRVSAIDSKVDTNDRKFRDLLEKEMADRASDIAVLRGKLEEQYFGDVRLQVAALIVLVLSIIFANAPDESAIVFKAAGLGGKYW